MLAKKYLLIFALLAFTFKLSAQNAITLDNAIQTSANQIMGQILIRDTLAVQDINATLNNITTIAILDFEAPSVGVSDYIVSEFTAYLLTNPRFSVVDRDNLDRARTELNFNMTGEVSDRTAQRIGQFVGAQVVLFGSIKQIKNMYRMQVRAINVETGIVRAQVNTNNIRKQDIRPFIGRQPPEPRPPRKPREREPVRASAAVGFSTTFFTSGGTLGFDMVMGGLSVGINLQSSDKFFLNILGDAGGGIGYKNGSYYFGGSAEILLLKYFLLGAGGGMTGATELNSGNEIIPFSPYIRGSLAFKLFPNEDEMSFSIKAFYDYYFDYGYRMGIAISILSFFN